MYTPIQKEKAKQLIVAGKTYKEIKNVLGIPKSTLSTWYGGSIKKPVTRRAILKHLARIRKLATLALKNKFEKKRQEEERIINIEVQKILKGFPENNLSIYKVLLAILYWAEGSRHKGMSWTKFANTDPDLTLLYITLLRKCYNLNENKFRVALYVHYYHSIKQVKNFWSDLLDVPLNQFNKVYIKKRSKTKKFRKNFAGICFIYYGDSRIRKELMTLGYLFKQFVLKNFEKRP